MLHDTVRQFVDQRAHPDRAHGRDGHKLKPEYAQHLETKARDSGLIHYDVPREYGGLGMGLLRRWWCGPRWPQHRAAGARR